MREFESRSGITRREALAIAGIAASSSTSAQNPLQVVPRHPAGEREYLTRDADFGTVERGDPLPYSLAESRLREIGMTRDTWRLEVAGADGAKVDAPLTRERGTALDWPGLMDLARTRAVRFLKVVSCNNLNAPLGMGLWEGVPLRDVVWLARPVSDIRRVYYYGHHNEDPKQMFRSSLPLGRVLEDPPGDNPVILAYKLNGDFLTGRRGGPVRVVVPEAYGFKSIKWLQRIVLTNLPGANDTYAEEGNDVDSAMKTMARVETLPNKVKAGQPIPVSGVAQVGMSGLKTVQVWLSRKGDPLPGDDPFFTRAPWSDARILGPPRNWGGGLPSGIALNDVRGFDPSTGRPREWPMRYAIVHWTATLPGLPSGTYNLRCRTVDANGIGQPMPRPIGRSGINHLEVTPLVVG